MASSSRTRSWLTTISAPRQHVAEGRRRRPRAALAWSRVLREVAERAAMADHARRRRRVTAQHLQQTGLSRAVAAHEADLLAGAHEQGRVLDHRTSAHL